MCFQRGFNVVCWGQDIEVSVAWTQECDDVPGVSDTSPRLRSRGRCAVRTLRYRNSGHRRYDTPM